MDKKIIHHIELSHLSPNISGGETILIGIVRYLTKCSDISQVIYTSESGVAVYRKQLGQDGKNVDFVVIGGKKIENINQILAYYLRVFQLFGKLKKFSVPEENIILSHEEFLPTLIYSFLLKKLNRKSKWFGIFHMRSPSIWRGFEGEYTGRWQIPTLRIIRYRFEQWLFFKFSRRNLETLITVNSIYKSFLQKIYKNVYVLNAFGGEYVSINESDKEKKFDMCFMGRFHEQKGLFEVVDILKRLKKEKPNISLALLGGGVERVQSKFFRMIKDEKLGENIEYFGYVNGKEKFDILQSCWVFLFPSYYESFGQVALEAMKCGLPVISYNIPPFQVFKKGMVKVPVLDNKKMALEILKLLNDKNYYEKVRKEGIEFSSDFSWEKTGQEVYNLIVTHNGKIK